VASPPPRASASSTRRRATSSRPASKAGSTSALLLSVPDDPKPRSTAAIDGKAVPTGTTDAEREANRQRVNNDRSAYTQQGLRPAGGEPWRGHVGGVDESFFWGGSTGKRAW